MKDWIKALDTTSFGTGTYSQSYQDELIDIVFDNVNPRNSEPFCIEFGFNSSNLDDGTGANVAHLALDKKWKCLLLDGGFENPAINLYRHFLTPSTICEVFRKYNVPKEPEYISIDVDSTDLWLFDSVLREYRAMLFTVEYNSHFPLSAAITFPNDPNEHFQNDRAYGASLRALNMVAVKHGYSLLWVVPTLDAFFIRNDLIDDGSDELCFPLEKWQDHTALMCHSPLKDKSRASMFIDYEEYVRTNGDLAKSKQKATPVCEKYLVGSLPERMKSSLKKLIKQS
jgi:hypothetical protein